jgi:AraC-like DNA-binding protein
VRAILTNKVRIQGWDYIHFLPAVVVLINVLPYSLLPVEYKRQFVAQLFHDSSIIYRIYFPLVSFTFYFIFRSVLSIGYIILSARILWKSVREGKLNTVNELKKWLVINLGLATVFNLILITSSIYSLYSHDFILILDQKGLGRTFGTIVMAALWILVYFFPKILYGLQSHSGDSLTDVIQQNEKIAKASKSTEFSVVRLSQVGKALADYLPRKRHLEPGFSLSDLVKDVGIPEHVLTYYFNNHLGITFLKWKNQLRIEEAIQLLRSGKADTNTLESVGKTCGYKSRSNFIQAFKTQTGVSPSAFLKKLS